MSSLCAGLFALILVTFPSPAYADSYAAFSNFRQADPTGHFYIVVKKNGGPADPGRGTPVTFEIAERQPGSPPLAPAADERKGLRAVVANPEVKVREGDILLGKGSLDRCPSRILISSTGLGFVGLDVRGYNYGSLRSGDALVVVAKDGTVRHRKDLIDLFNEGEVARFMRSAGGVWWCGGGWIDEGRKEIIVVGSGSGQEDEAIPRLFRIVDMESGKVRDGSPDVVLTALSEVNLGELDQAIDLTAELKLDRAKPDLVKIFSSEKIRIESRLHAAVALGTMGDRRGGDLMRQVAFDKTGPRYYAIQNLPAVLGDEAAPVLCEVVRRSGKEWSSTAWQAMHSVSGRAAVPPLLKLLQEDKPDGVDFALECLGNKGPEAAAAIPDMIKLLDSEPKTKSPLWTQQLAAMALGRIGPKAGAALPSLIRLSEKHAPEEWAKFKDNQPELRNDNFGGKKYADDYFVDAICKIRH
ncbi:MAG: hypothetical protein JWN86_1364 [Planctomycetota bacterium]|nr:hypothetical protein [Planctomycetota bacterium]